MRNALVFLALVVMGILAAIVLLPILGVLFLVVAGLFVVAVAAFLSAPLLARLPWFRDRIFVERRGAARTIRFGRGAGAGRGPARGPGGGGQDDVIDVEGREVPDQDGEDPRG